MIRTKCSSCDGKGYFEVEDNTNGDIINGLFIFVVIFIAVYLSNVWGIML